MRIANRISVDPDVLHGAAAIEGTRVPVSIVVGSLAGGMSRADIVREYGIADQDIDAALSYAADVVSHTADLPLVPA